MKVIVVLALVLAVVSATNWKSAEDQAVRKVIIEKVNTAKKGWTAGVNPRFDGASFSYLKSLLGSLEDKAPNHAGLEIVSDVAAAIPDAFDWRVNASLCPSLNEIRDQSNCGSCWAFGAAEAATDRLCLQSNGAEKYHISAEDILSCCSTCGSGCNGGYPSSAWSWLVRTGSVTGGNYQDYSWCYSYALPTCDHHTTGQYTPCTDLPSYPTPQCKSACDSQSTYSISYNNDKRKFGTSYGVSSSVTAIQTEIMNYGPVEASFSVYADFESYTGGIYQHTTGAYMGGHAVKILGWGVGSSPDPVEPYWIVANSWNNDWGENGFFRILRGVNECGIEASIVAGKI
jgi:cathepsin B